MRVGPEPPAARSRRGRRILAPLVAIALGGALGAAAGVVAADRERSYPVFRGVTARSFDPDFDGEENDRLLPRLTDANPATTWRTFESLANKNGVGVYAVLDQPRELRSVTVLSETRGWRALVFVADSPGATLADWGAAVAELPSSPDRERTVNLGGRTGQYVLIWITSFGEEQRVAISELLVRGE